VSAALTILQEVTNKIIFIITWRILALPSTVVSLALAITGGPKGHLAK
jgi:hypothetical protein